MSESHKKKANRLISSNSPYLQQHAYNPVHWMEWSNEALQKAEHENKLLIVSIGYSSCHWCHVMERESFEDRDTADIMNEFYVSVKVDREERPDIDQLYMDAVQLMTGRGGWPLNVVCLPDGRPIWGGTYFPQVNWNQNLLKLANFYRNQPEKAREYASKLEVGIQEMSIIPDALKEQEAAQLKDLLHYFLEIEREFDQKWGGHGNPPKFPMPALWEFIGKASEIFPASNASQHLNFSLHAMAQGGLYDLVGGGFSRYSVDEKWLVPHFEKMLYDNALLLSLYARQYRRNPNPLLLHVIERSMGWLKREIKSPNGGYFSALDADSEGVEGKFYLWTANELREEADSCGVRLDDFLALDAGQWEDSIIPRLCSSADVQSPEWIKLIDQLLEKRNERIRPGLDDKVLSGWNGLLLSGLCDAWKVLQKPEWMDMICELADFLSEKMYHKGVLYRTLGNNNQHIAGFAEDYAAVAKGLLQAGAVSGNENYSLKAKQLTDAAIDRFYDAEKQFFAFTPMQEQTLISRKYETQDNVIPSCNAIFGHVLFNLWERFEEHRYLEICDAMLNRMRAVMEKFPAWHAHWAHLLSLRIRQPKLICITGKRAQQAAKDLYAQHHLPDDCILFNEGTHSDLPVFANRITGELRFYVCEGQQCLKPVDSIQEVLEQLQQVKS